MKKPGSIGGIKYLLPFLLPVMALFMSCHSNNTCKHVSCENGGACYENTGCLCPTGYRGVHCEYVGCPFGYEGADCKTESRYKFIGYWTTFEDGTIALPAQYPITIEARTVTGISDPVYVSVRNINNFSSKSFLAYIVGDTIVIPTQESEGRRVVGRGVCKTTTTYGVYGLIEMRYQVTDIATGQVDDYGYDTVAYPGSKVSEWSK